MASGSPLVLTPRGFSVGPRTGCGGGQPRCSPAPSGFFAPAWRSRLLRGLNPSGFCRCGAAVGRAETGTAKFGGCGYLIHKGTPVAHPPFSARRRSSFCAIPGGWWGSGKSLVPSVGAPACVGVCGNPCGPFLSPALICSVTSALKKTSHHLWSQKLGKDPQASETQLLKERDNNVEGDRKGREKKERKGKEKEENEGINEI